MVWHGRHARRAQGDRTSARHRPVRSVSVYTPGRRPAAACTNPSALDRGPRWSRQSKTTTARIQRFPQLHLIILWRQLIINIPYQADAHLGGVVPAQHVADEVGLDLHLHHLEGAAQHAAQDVGVPQLVLGAAVVGQLDKVGKGVLVEDERELLAVARPVGDGRDDVEEDLEADLSTVCVSTEWPVTAVCAPAPPTESVSSPTLAIISAVSRKLEHRRTVFDLAR